MVGGLLVGTAKAKEGTVVGCYYRLDAVELIIGVDISQPAELIAGDKPGAKEVVNA